MNISDIVITSLETIQCYDVSNGAYLFTLDELQNATISQTEEKTDLTGKKGRKLNTMKRNKAVTVSGSNGMVSFGLLAAQIGGISPIVRGLFSQRRFISAHSPSENSSLFIASSFWITSVI